MILLSQVASVYYLVGYARPYIILYRLVELINVKTGCNVIQGLSLDWYVVCTKLSQCAHGTNSETNAAVVQLIVLCNVLKHCYLVSARSSKYEWRSSGIRHPHRL